MNFFERLAKYMSRNHGVSASSVAGGGFGQLYADTFNKQKKENAKAKQLAGATNWSSRFYDGYLGLNDKEKEQWKKEHEEYENTVSRKHPNASEQQRDIWRNNKFKQEIIKGLKTQEGKQLQSMLFDENGKLANKDMWKNIDTFMAQAS